MANRARSIGAQLRNIPSSTSDNSARILLEIAHRHQSDREPNTWVPGATPQRAPDSNASDSSSSFPERDDKA
jgi:hypothetical protein